MIYKEKITKESIMIRPYTKQEEEILRQGLMSSEIVEDIGDRMKQEIMEVTNG